MQNQREREAMSAVMINDEEYNEKAKLFEALLDFHNAAFILLIFTARHQLAAEAS